MAEKQEKEEQKDKKIESYGQVLLGEDEHNGKIQLMTIIGEQNDKVRAYFTAACIN